MRGLDNNLIGAVDCHVEQVRREGLEKNIGPGERVQGGKRPRVGARRIAQPDAHCIPALVYGRPFVIFGRGGGCSTWGMLRALEQILEIRLEDGRGFGGWCDRISREEKCESRLVRDPDGFDSGFLVHLGTFKIEARRGVWADELTSRYNLMEWTASSFSKHSSVQAANFSSSSLVPNTSHHAWITPTT